MLGEAKRWPEHNASRCRRRAVGAGVAALLVASCAGDQHQSVGRFRLTVTGALVEGVARAEYAHRFSSTGPGFTIGFEIPAGNGVFSATDSNTGVDVGTDRGLLVFALDSLPGPGTYTAVSVGQPRDGMLRGRRVGVLLSSSSGAQMWIPVGGEVRFARTPDTRDGLRAAFNLRLVRTQGGSTDTAVVTGALETR